MHFGVGGWTQAGPASPTEQAREGSALTTIRMTQEPGAVLAVACFDSEGGSLGLVHTLQSGASPRNSPRAGEEAVPDDLDIVRTVDEQ